MRNRSQTIAAVLIAMGVLSAGYLYLSTRPKPTPPPKENPAVQIWKFDKEKLVRIVLSDRAEGPLIAEKRDGGWKLDYLLSIRLNETKLDQLMFSFADLVAERIVEEQPTDLAQYGLAPPRAAARAALDDGTERTFFLGDLTPAGTTYYLQEKGDARVYAVWRSVGENFHWTVSDLRDRKIDPPIYSDGINYLLIRQRDGVQLELRRKTSAESNDYTLGGFGKYLVTRPYAFPRGVDPERSVSTIRGPAGIEIADFVDDSPEDLSIYGLDRPQGETIVRDNAVTLHFLFGAEAGAEKLYFKLADRPPVYTVERSRLAYLSSKPFDLIDKFAFNPPIEEVDRIEITAAGKTHIFTLTRTVKKATTTDAATKEAKETEEVLTTYQGDGKDLEEPSFQAFYFILSRLKIDGEANNPRALAPAVRTRFLLNKGAPRDVTIDFVPYNRDFFALSLNGKSEFGVSTGQLDSMIEMMNRLLAGEKMTP